MQINFYYQVGRGKSADFVFPHDQIHRASEHAEKRLDLFRFHGSNFEMNCDDHVRAHLANHIGWEIADQATVHQHLIADPHRIEQSGN